MQHLQNSQIKQNISNKIFPQTISNKLSNKWNILKQNIDKIYLE